MRCPYRIAVLLSAIFTLLPCPAVADGLPRALDLTCDGVVDLVFLGDSIVFGVGDSARDGAGGYPLRLRQLTRGVKVRSLGFPGITANQLLHKVKSSLAKPAPNAIARRLATADVAFLDVGRNDFFRSGNPQATVGAIRRTARAIRSRFGQAAPFLVVVQPLPTLRPLQMAFLRELARENLEIPIKNLEVFEPLGELTSLRFISADGLHPTSLGYDAIALSFLEYLEGPLAELLARKRDCGPRATYTPGPQSKS